LVNDQLCADNRSEMFVTVFYAILDLRSGDVEYANGGHNPPYVVRAGGGVEPVERTGDPILAALEGIRYRGGRLRCAPGDGLVLYTDGVTEAMDAEERLFGEHRLAAYLQRAGGTGAEALVRGLVEEVRHFAGGVSQSDDLTVMAVAFRGR
jgi:sigma-B regulation protein RsbU (phosphoserine phosphatase)